MNYRVTNLCTTYFQGTFIAVAISFDWVIYNRNNTYFYETPVQVDMYLRSIHARCQFHMIRDSQDYLKTIPPTALIANNTVGYSFQTDRQNVEMCYLQKWFYLRIGINSSRSNIQYSIN